MSELTIKEIKTKKIETELEIREILSDFMKNTGLIIDGLRIDIYTEIIGGDIIGNVKLDVRLK